MNRLPLISCKGSPYSSMAGMENSSRRSFLAKLSALALAARTRRMGQRTRQPHLCRHLHQRQRSTSQGIYAFRWDADAGTLDTAGAGGRYRQPSFLALSPDRRHLYAVNEVDEYHGEKSGSVSSFAVEGVGKLKPINIVSSGGGRPVQNHRRLHRQSRLRRQLRRRQRCILPGAAKRSTQQGSFHVSIHWSRRRPGAPGRSSCALHHCFPRQSLRAGQ